MMRNDAVVRAFSRGESASFALGWLLSATIPLVVVATTRRLLPAMSAWRAASPIP